MSARRRVRIVDRGDTFVIQGWRGGDLAKEAGIHAVFNGVAAGWVADGRRLPDFLAYLQYRNLVVAVVTDGGDAA